MANEQPKDSNETSGGAEPNETPKLVAGADWLLADLVALADLGYRSPITIMSGGTTITGLLVNGHEWFEALEAFLKGAGGKLSTEEKEMYDGIAERLGSNREAYPEPGSEEALAEPKFVLSFVHLIEAKIILGGGQMIPSVGMLWRAKLAAVDGFSYGRWSTD